MLRRYKKSTSALIAVAAGVIFGLANYALADPECEMPTSIEGPGAQDTNGDGLATIAEGAFDLDEDGKFTCVEAAHFGMDCFICWAANCEDEDPVIELVENSICMTDCRNSTKSCRTWTGSTCKKTSTGCKG